MAITEYVREYGAASDDEEIVTIVVPKAKHGFEVILLALLDYMNKDRKFRRMILDPRVKEIGIVQVTHPQIDFLNMIILKKQKGTLEMPTLLHVESTFVRNTIEDEETILFNNHDNNE